MLVKTGVYGKEGFPAPVGWVVNTVVKTYWQVPIKSV